MTEQWLLVLRAADTAARWHVNQRRKGATAEPYINHLLEVAMLVAEATEGKDAELIMAALLHDAIEDQKMPLENIASAFGENVAAIVQEVTDDKSLEKSERKRRKAFSTAHRQPADGRYPPASGLDRAARTPLLLKHINSPSFTHVSVLASRSLAKNCGFGRETVVLPTQAIRDEAVKRRRLTHQKTL